MSVDYYVYVEGKKDDKWRNLNTYVKNNMGEFELVPSYFNGSRTYFGACADKLKMLGDEIYVKDLSDDLFKHVRTWFDNEEDFEEFLEEDSKRHGAYLFAVSLSELKRALPEVEYDSSGFISKSELVQYKLGELELDEISDFLTPAEYRKLNKNEQKGYEYFEWSDPMGWSNNLRNVYKAVEVDISKWQSINYERFSEIRVILYISY